MKKRWQLAPACKYCEGAGGQSLVRVSGSPGRGVGGGENGERILVVPRWVTVTVRTCGASEGVTMPKSSSLGAKIMGVAGLVIAGRETVWLVVLVA